jgi:DNA-binding transcriptional LysR family regulator
VELRDIEIFLMLAEELHFGRTADRLHISQARVSQAIKKQERRIGGALFERTSRHVRLTPIGEQLRDDLRAGYDTIQAGLAKATDNARGVAGTLRVGVMGIDSFMFLGVIERFRRRNPGCDLEVREVHFSDAFHRLRAGDVDLIVAWRPIREAAITEGPVAFTVGRVLIVWSDHELAGIGAVSMEDLADHIFIDPGPVPDYWMEAMLPTHTPNGRLIRRTGPRVSTFHEVLSHVAARQCVALCGEHGRLYDAPLGVAFVKIHDAPPLDWALAWRTGDESPLVRAFAQATREVGPSTLHDLLENSEATSAAEVRVTTDGGRR